MRDNATKAEITQVYRTNRDMKVAQTDEMHYDTKQRSLLQQARNFDDHKWSSKELISINCEDVPDVVNVDAG